MARIKSLLEILQLAKIAQYLSFNDKANKCFLKGGTLDNRLPVMISMERNIIQWTYDTDPVDSTLRATSSYLYDLLGIYALQAQNILNNLSQAAPVVSGPSNASANVGQNASFTISVVSSLSYVIAWYKNGILIVGETGLTYTLTSAQLADSGAAFYATATSPAGTGLSATATLTVSANISGQYYYGDINYYTELAAGIDNVPYIASFPITNGQPLSVPWPLAATNNKCQVIKYPISQGVKTSFFNTASNQGAIPSVEYWDVLTIGSYLYIVSRGEISLDASSPTTTYS